MGPKLGQGIVLGSREKRADAGQEEMTYGHIRHCRESGKKQGYGLDRTLAYLSIKKLTG